MPRAPTCKSRITTQSGTSRITTSSRGETVTRNTHYETVDLLFLGRNLIGYRRQLGQNLMRSAKYGRAIRLPCVAFGAISWVWRIRLSNRGRFRHNKIHFHWILLDLKPSPKSGRQHRDFTRTSKIDPSTPAMRAHGESGQMRPRPVLLSSCRAILPPYVAGL